jgi:hypothetical protein
MIIEKDGIESVFTVGDLIEELSQYPKDYPVRAIIFKQNSLAGGPHVKTILQPSLL